MQLRARPPPDDVVRPWCSPVWRAREGKEPGTGPAGYSYSSLTPCLRGSEEAGGPLVEVFFSVFDLPAAVYDGLERMVEVVRGWWHMETISQVYLRRKRSWTYLHMPGWHRKMLSKSISCIYIRVPRNHHHASPGQGSLVCRTE
jgi:hypothetical protein